MEDTVLHEFVKRQRTYTKPIAGYIPRNDLTAIAIALYGITTILLWIQWFRHGRQKWMLVLTIGALCMMTGYWVRIGMHSDPYSLTVYIVSTLFTLLSPCAFLAVDYMALGRLSLYLGSDVTSQCLVLKANVIAKLFVASDIIAFLIQAAGGAMTASGQTNPKMGELGQKVSMAGLSLQLAAFASFTVILLLFGYRVRKLFPHKWNAGTIHAESQIPYKPLYNFWDTTPIIDWRILYFAMCLTCIGFLTRSGFRVAEFEDGYSGYLYVTEAFFYSLDALPIWLAINVFVFIWPTRFMKHPELFPSSAFAAAAKGSEGKSPESLELGVGPALGTDKKENNSTARGNSSQEEMKDVQI